MRISLLISFLFCLVSVQAQPGLYLKDLASLKSILEKTPSYKSQIKGNRLADYNTLYKALAADTMNLTSYKYFQNLSKLLSPIRDNHLAFYEISANNLKDNESIDRYISSKEFLTYPSSKVNIHSLEAELRVKSPDSIEGIYYYSKLYSVGLYKQGPKEYIGVIIDSNFKIWTKGQIAIHLEEYKPGMFKAIYTDPYTKGFVLNPNEKYEYPLLLNSRTHGYFYTKENRPLLYSIVPQHSSRFKFEGIDENTQYLLLQTFKRNKRESEQSLNFYRQIKDSLTAPNLILDLRDNEGGAEIETKKYLKLMTDYTKNGVLYVLINNNTVSQAEIFTLKLMKLKNVITIGQTSKGMLTYGTNYGTRERLPSGKFEIAITDMRGKANHLKYESIGISPDVILDRNSDWIDQVVNLINKK